MARYGVRRSLRSRAALGLGLLLAATAVATVDGIVAPVEAFEVRAEAGLPVERGDPALLAEVARSQHLLGLVTFLTVGDDAQRSFLLEARPAILSGIWLVLLLLTPFLVAFAAFDQTADDIGSRWMRFVLFRTRRASLFAGRLLASSLSLAALLALLVAAILVYVDLRVGVYARGDLYAWGLDGYLALLGLALPYVALCGLVSAASRASVRALAACFLATALPIVGIGLLSASLESAAWIELLHPWGWKLRLLHPDAATRAAAFAAMGGFTGAAAAAGAALLARRDL